MVGWHHQLDGHEFEQASGSFQMRVDSLENTLMLGKIEGERRRGQPKMRQLDGITTQWV